MSCPIQHCPTCGDRLIHQENRGSNESASALGQHIHDKFPNTFWFMDIDAIVYKRATRILRVIERKKTNQDLRPSQSFLLPLLAIGIAILKSVGTLDQQSGVFKICIELPFEHGEISKVIPIIPIKFGDCFSLSGDELECFLTAKRIQVKE